VVVVTQLSGPRAAPAGSAGARRLGAGLLALCLMLAGAGAAVASPGQVDYSFGYFGTLDITNDLPGANSEKEALAMAIGPANETIVVSSKTVPCASPVFCSDLFVTRYDTNGALDPAFGPRAGALMRVEAPSAPGSQPRPQAALAVGKDGRTTIAAGTGAGILVTRLNPDGGLDLSFGAGGRVETVLGGAGTVTGIALGKAGSILVTGGVAKGTGNDLLLARYTATGQLDPDFGLRGIAAGQIGPGDNVPAAVAVSKGKAYLGAPVCCSAAGQPMRVGVYAEDGTRSRLVEVRLPKRLKAGSARGISTVIAAAHGATLVVGSAGKGTFVARLLPSGKPDPTFGDRGYSLVPKLFVEGPTAAALDRRGRIVLSGWRYDTPDSEGHRAKIVRVFRLLPGGRPDRTFGGVRPLLTVVMGTQKLGLDLNRGIAMAQRADGKVMILAETKNDPRARLTSGPWFGLVRVVGGGRLETPRPASSSVAR
jgi:uncharacterized delta-60 repeat protein